MSSRTEKLAERLQAELGQDLVRVAGARGELGYELAAADWVRVATRLRDGEGLAFETLVDLCGVDYLGYGQAEWRTRPATHTGFSRGVDRGPKEPRPGRRYAVVAHLLSVSLNHRLRIKCYPEAGDPPVVPSLVDVWPAANWFEREAFDLFGILFDGHPDLRRILTDYGFVGHPFRKDFPLIGNVEVRYDPEQGRVVYQPVTIEPRTLVPKVIRRDHRYERGALTDRPPGGDGRG